MPENNNTWLDDCKVCGVRLKRPRADMLCKRCRYNYKRRVAYQSAHPRVERPVKLCGTCQRPLGKGNRSGHCKRCWKQRGNTITRVTADARFLRTLATRPAGWIEKLDKLGERAARQLPLFE